MKLKNTLKIAVGASILLTAQIASADFSGGIPAGWVCDGNCGTLGADGVVAASPLGSAQYGYVSSNTSNSGVGLGLGSETSGSTLTSSVFSATAGDALNFYFNYVTSDGAGFADYAWAKLLNADGTEAALLFTARTQTSGNIIPGQGMPLPNATVPNTPIIAGGPAWAPLAGDSGDCYAAGCGYTGWVLSSFNIAAAGDYKLEFGVVNWIDSAFDSGLAFDGITVAGKPIDTPPSTVPVPAAAWLFGSALAGFAGLRRKKSV